MKIKLNRKLPVFLLIFTILFWSCANDSSTDSTSAATNTTNSTSNSTNTNENTTNPETKKTSEADKIAAQISGNTYVLSKYVLKYNETKTKNHTIEYDTESGTINNNIITVEYKKSDDVVFTEKITINNNSTNNNSTWTYQKNNEEPVTVNNLDAGTEASKATKKVIEYTKWEWKFNSDKTGNYVTLSFNWDVNSDGNIQYILQQSKYTLITHSDDSYNTWYSDTSVDLSPQRDHPFTTMYLRKK